MDDPTRSARERDLRDRAADGYDAWYLERGVAAVAAEDRAILGHLDARPGQAILDAGCGTGRFLAGLARAVPGLRLFGVDLSPRSLAVLASRGIGATTAVADLSRDPLGALGFPPFDRILSVQMLQHLTKEGAAHALRELSSALAPGGRLVVELYNYAGLNRIVERLRARGRIRKIQSEGSFFEYRYSPGEFAAFAVRHGGFRGVRLYGASILPRPLVNRLPSLVGPDVSLSRFGASRWLGYYFIAVCERGDRVIPGR